MTTETYRFWRRVAGAAEAAVLLGLPFLRISGESALRFDVLSLRLHFFGAAIWMDEFFLVLAALLFITALFLLITLVFGRIWCGWLCPQTVLCDITGSIDRSSGKPFFTKIKAYLFTMLVSILVGASLVWYFVSPYEFIPSLLDGTLGPVPFWSWIVLSGLAFGNYGLLRHTWCATACPYAKLQGALFDRNTLIIAYDPLRSGECMDCRACVRDCPVGIDIRNGPDAACISCASCIDACAARMGRKEKKSLIDYVWGTPGEQRRLFRTNALMLALLTGASVVFLLLLIASRKPADMTVLPNSAFPARVTASGETVNSYIISISNRGPADLTFSVGAAAEGFILNADPDRITVRAGELKKIPIFLIRSAASHWETPLPVHITLQAVGQPAFTLSGNVSFFMVDR